MTAIVDLRRTRSSFDHAEEQSAEAPPGYLDRGLLLLVLNVDAGPVLHQ